jgi:phosphoserine phosphatase RsbU/P
MNSEIVVPLMHKSPSDRRAQHPQPQPRPVHRDRRRDRRQFGVHVAVALANARLFERERQDAEAFETLAEIGRDVASVLDLDELFTRIAQLTKRVIDYRTFGILC